jgi:hypothetical protein
MQNKIRYLTSCLYKGNGSPLFFLFRHVDAFFFSQTLNTGFAGLETLRSPPMLCCVKNQDVVALA